jgi:PPOX class probable F420-dependent enzyme
MAALLRREDLAFLDEQRVAHLATAGETGRPHVVPVCFARIGERIYVPIDAKPKRGDPRALRRLRNLRARPEAALLVDHYEEDWSKLRWLLIYARAVILEDGPEREAALQALEQRYAQYAAMRLAALGLPVIALQPETVRRWSAHPLT